MELTMKQKRKQVGQRVGLMGLLLNLVLAVIKYMAGTMSHSVAISADAMDSLTDAVSSLVTMIGFQIANRKSDSIHPYGHGRMEYLCGFFVSLLIMGTGISVGKSAIEQILHPDVVTSSFVLIVLLMIGILGKCFFSFYAKRRNQDVQSTALQAIQSDSLSDALVSATTLMGMLIAPYLPFSIDGWLGLFVTFIILKAGVTSLWESVVVLLGEGISKKDRKIVKDIIHLYAPYANIKNMFLHDYGPEEKILYIDIRFMSPEDYEHFTMVSDVIQNEVMDVLDMEVVLYHPICG